MKTAPGKENPAAASPPSSEKSPARAEDASNSKIKSLEDERDRLKAELADARDKFLRSRADYENLARRTQRQYQDTVKAAKATLLLRFASIMETLEKATGELERATPEHARGLKLVVDEMRKLLKDESVKEIESFGQPFNYRYHQAVEQVETDSKPEGVILDVVQRGYTLEGEILRPALVKVAAPPKRPAPPPSKEEPKPH